MELPVDEVVINHGYERDTSLLENSRLDVTRVDDYYIAGTSNCQSSVPGLYAAGDIVHYEGKLHLIAGAFQDAANAVNSAKRFIDPEAHKSAMVSSHNEVFKERNREPCQEDVRVDKEYFSPAGAADSSKRILDIWQDPLFI